MVALLKVALVNFTLNEYMMMMMLFRFSLFRCCVRRFSVVGEKLAEREIIIR